jgi:Mor family transcriptional regulator
MVHEKVAQVITQEGEEIILQRLPKLLSEIAELIGVSSACQLARRFGGTRITFSCRRNTHDAVMDMLGPAKAARLAEHYRGEEVAIPRASRLETFLKHRDVIQRRGEGAKVRDLALQYRLTERQIWQILAAKRQPTPETV